MNGAPGYGARDRRAARWLAIIPLLLASGCYYTVTTQPPPADARATASPPGPAPYRIHVGDTLAIKFYNNRDLDQELTVRPDGKISLPLAGDMQAAGLEPSAVADAIEAAYRSELARPRPAVMLTKIGARVYVGGEVEKPGAYFLSPNLTLVQAIQEAGGFRPEAHLSQVVLIRRARDGQPAGFAVDVRPVIGGTQPGDDLPLQPDDIAFVPRSKIADVDLWVKQYIRDMLPIQPGIGFIP
jgi:protein involved in polysaccharide export with SLBB domain